jgi:hypothetical protein
MRLLLVCVVAALGAAPETGRVTVRRLNRTEYNHTVADLLGTTLRPSDDFPPEDSTFGFDNVAEAMTVSPLQARLYEGAATALIDDAFARGRLPGCDLRAAACVPDALARFAALAWRRPVAADEARALAALARRLGRGADGARAAFRAVLLSPHFLFRVEPSPPGPWALASRLSYFLWSSLPDEALRASAASGRLAEPDELRAQALRMLDDERSARFVTHFAGQWLPLRALGGHYVDRAAFRDYDDELAASMRRETELTFTAFLREPRGIATLLTAPFTFVDDRLARHYGLPPVGPGFHRVDLEATDRRGLLAQASLLTATSHADRTGVVKRGQWVLSQLLCDEPPPPPPGVPALPSQQQVEGSQRDRLEEHRTEVRCSACHKIMDAIGFGLENYDGIGRWRTKDGKFAIDATGKLPGGVTFDGPRALAERLAEDPRFPRCLAQRLFTYALGRPPTAAETPAADRDTTLRDLMLAIVTSDAFRGGAR